MKDWKGRGVRTVRWIVRGPEVDDYGRGGRGAVSRHSKVTCSCELTVAVTHTHAPDQIMGGAGDIIL